MPEFCALQLLLVLLRGRWRLIQKRTSVACAPQYGTQTAQFTARTVCTVGAQGLRLQ